MLGRQQRFDNQLANEMIAIIGKFSCFPVPIITTQCKVLQKTPQDIVASDVPELARRIGQAVAMFTDPTKGTTVEREILGLARRANRG